MSMPQLVFVSHKYPSKMVFTGWDVPVCAHVQDPDANPVCLPCYNDKYALVCGTCETPITAGQRAMRAGDKSYCDTDSCFKCKNCTKYLGNQKVVQYQGSLYCSECYREVHSPPCGRCGERIHGEFVEVRGKRYKKSCFNCFECGVVFTREEKKGAYPIGDQLLCYTHALAARRKELKEQKERKAKEAQEAEAKEEAAKEEAAKEEAAKEEAAKAAEEAEETERKQSAILSPTLSVADFDNPQAAGEDVSVYRLFWKLNVVCLCSWG